MIEAIQRAYYLRAMNPSETEVLVQLAVELGLDVGQFSNDLEAEKTHQTLAHQVAFSHSSPIAGFPSLMLEIAGQQWAVAVDYKDHHSTLEQIIALSNGVIK